MALVRKSGLTTEDKTVLGIAGVAVLFYLAWIAFVVWAIYSVVHWLISK